MSKKTNAQKLRNRLQLKKGKEFFIEEYTKKRLKEFLKEDKIDIKILERAKKLLS